MAWLNEQTWFTYSSNIRLIGNISPSSITHNGTTLRVKGTIAAGARGSSGYLFYYSDYTSYAQPEGATRLLSVQRVEHGKLATTMFMWTSMSH